MHFFKCITNIFINRLKLVWCSIYLLVPNGFYEIESGWNTFLIFLIEFSIKFEHFKRQFFIVQALQERNENRKKKFSEKLIEKANWVKITNWMVNWMLSADSIKCCYFPPNTSFDWIWCGMKLSHKMKINIRWIKINWRESRALKTRLLYLC